MYAIKTWTLCDGFINMWTNPETGEPILFQTYEQANQELQIYLEDRNSDEECEPFDVSDFKIEKI